jgi:osmoprotectant transport system substrate-binding protein
MGVPSTAEDKDVVYCAKTFTDANTIATLTDLGTKPGLATLAAPDGFAIVDFSNEPQSVKDLYGIEFKSVVPTAAEKTLDAINAGTADCGIGRAADPALGAATLTVLQDDKALVPNDVILPLVGGDASSDDALSVIDAMTARLTPDSLRALMSRLNDGASPEIVANEFTGNAGPDPLAPRQRADVEAVALQDRVLAFVLIDPPEADEAGDRLVDASRDAPTMPANSS